jgi:putative protein-disulfide isomerase
MEITLLEDPACSWCWAFQPVVTAVLYELAGSTLKNSIRIRSVMGGLCDRPAVEASFFARHWQTAAELSGMPFNVAIWDRHVLQTTFEACRAVKAALSQGPAASNRFLRRIREAYHVEGVPIDNRETLIELARGEGLDADALREDLSNGRAEFLFDRDRREAAEYRFGFPTLLIRKHPNDPPTTLNGVVTYAEVLETLEIIGQSPRDRRRFAGRPEDWDRLFSIHPRLTLAEIRQVSRLDGEALAESCARNGIHEEGAFFVREPKPAMMH